MNFVCAEIQLANHKLRFSLFHFIKSFPPKGLMKGPLRIAAMAISIESDRKLCIPPEVTYCPFFGNHK
jgi:hypothetical protein